MFRFTIECCLFAVIMFATSFIWPMYLLQNDRYQHRVAGSEIYRSLKKSRTSTASTVILGDSVGNQIFDNRQIDRRFDSLACNQAISLAGQYVLMEEVIANNPNIKNIALLIHPSTLCNNLDQIYTFHYFVKPFMTPKYSAYMSDQVRSQVQKIPFAQYARVPQILTSNWAPTYDVPQRTGLSAIAKVYFAKIVALAKQHNIRFELVSPPISEKFRDDFNTLDFGPLSEANEQALNDYLSNLEYVCDEEFLDGVHLCDPVATREACWNEISESLLLDDETVEVAE